MIQDWLRDRKGDAFIVARYLYRVGEPVLSDSEYDALERFLKEEQYQEYKEYLCRSYDDDPIPKELLQELGIQYEDAHEQNALYDYLEEEKSNSIRPVRDWESAYDFMLRNDGRNFVMSLKLDGVNGKTLYRDGKPLLCLSRGRKGNSIDYSQGALRILPKSIDQPNLTKVTGEYFADINSLEYLRDKYDSSKYKTAKSSAISMLRVAHDDMDYEHLKFNAFYAEGDFATVTEMCEFLERNGFETPPRIRIKEWPHDKEAFKDWLFNKALKTLEVAGKNLPSDGVVLEVDDLTSNFIEHNQYSERQIALKFGHWDFGYEKGVITDIKIEQRRVYKSVRITIEPIRTKDGCRAEYINSYNPSILINNDLYVGKTVYFEKNSSAVNVLIYGPRLDNILKMEGNLDAKGDQR